MAGSKDGGAAFPFPLSGNNGGPTFPELGMSLRDYFAAHAPAMPSDLGALALEAADIDNPDKTHGKKSGALLAIRAEWNYLYAEAMLAARSDRS